MNIQQLIDYATLHNVKTDQLVILVNSDHLTDFRLNGDYDQRKYLDYSDRLNPMFANVSVVPVNFIQGFQIYRK